MSKNASKVAVSSGGTIIITIIMINIIIITIIMIIIL